MKAIKLTRREFLKKTAVAGSGISFGLAPLLFQGCTTTPKTHEEIFRGYPKRTQDWDPVYGPPILRGTYGFNDYAGHMSHPIARKRPGTDYELKKGTPLTGATKFILNDTRVDENGGNQFWLRCTNNEAYRIGYSHLYKKLIGKKSKLEIGRNVIIGYSGMSGKASAPHLHFGLCKWHHNSKSINEGGEYPNPEKFGLDGSLPVFWDGKIDLDVPFWLRPEKLENTIISLEDEINNWQGEHDLEELKGNVNEHFKLMGKVDYRTILKKNDG
jgi:Peptidase family M23